MSLQLITEQEAKELVTTADGGLVKMLLEGVSADFEKTCQRAFKLADYDELYDGNNRDRLVLRVFPVKEITSIAISGTSIPGSTYALDARSGIVRLTDGSRFPKGILNVQVVYKAGFEEIPDDIKLAVKTAISFLVNQKSRIGIQSVSTPDQITEYIDGKYPKLVTEILDKYTPRRAG